MKKKTCFFVIVFFVLFFGNNFVVKNKAESIEKQIETAIYRREDFFGVSAIVPNPTAEAYQNLMNISASNEPKVFEKLAELAEKLEKFEEAENFFIKTQNLDKLAEFYQRRGNFIKQAEVLEQIFKQTKRLNIFDKLIQFAKLHELNKYLQPEYFQQIANENEDSFPIIEKLIDKLIQENQNEKALIIIRQFKPKFPEKMLEKEVSLLSAKEAENVYQQSFNPFWSDFVAENFYRFLDQNDRFRAYGSELKSKFRKDSADYQTAIRLIHYKQYDSEEITPTVLQLKKAKTTWNADELLTISRFLLKEGNADLASKFLYTLHVRQEFSGEMREKILYQIFKIFCEAENQRLSLTKGDLGFYRDIAKVDTHPGIATGILSLIFADNNLNAQLIEKERVANKLFNQADAFRLFQAYKNEFPKSSEIGQMYLDLIEIYTKTKKTEIAEKLLNEFTENYQNLNNFPRVALNLADAFVISKNVVKERQIYQKIMDVLGKEGKFFSSQKFIENIEKNNLIIEPNNFNSLAENSFKKIVYVNVLNRYIESLAKEKKVSEILEVYSNEIAKYPQQEWIYEQRLHWLEQTNLFAEQLQFYKNTLEKFPNNTWRDKFARWFIRNKRQNEFNEFSVELVGKLNDSEVENYLSEFIDKDINLFNETLYLKLYLNAHQRFPHNLNFVKNLLKFYKTNKRETDWRNLSAEYYFESSEIRNDFLNELAKKGELQSYLNETNNKSIIHRLFRANANLHLSRYEEALINYKELNEIYPHHTEFSNHLVNLTRSFGQKQPNNLTDFAEFAKRRADFEPSNQIYRTESGEINAELGDYQTANSEWKKIIETGKGSSQIYLETASVYWDYFQYDEALQTIKDYRVKSNNADSYAFEVGAIFEAQNKNNEAITEYLKALENNSINAQKRLKKLAKDKHLFSKINAVFNTQKKNDWKTLNYAEILQSIDKKDEAEKLLKQEVSQNKNADFLESAIFFSDKIKPIALNSLARISTNPRKSIAYRFRLADFYRENNQPKMAQQVLADLLKTFPTNYGVLTETADFYWSLGASNQTIEVLEKGFNKAQGNYRFEFASRLAKRLISLNRLAEAEQFLTKIHQEKPTDSDIFFELTNVYVLSEKTAELRKILAETIRAIKLQNIEPKEVDEQIASLRKQMISAFTSLKDYRSAVEQHIEIINREPNSDLNIEAAIYYVKRYGEADLLLNYYQQTSAQAFKNYRWNVVLAKIYEANKDLENAVKNYHKAIDNQPEMIELYAELVKLETTRKNYFEALKQLEKIIELSGEDKDKLKQKVHLLQLLGRNEEAKIEQEKLPFETKKIVQTENKFAEAEKSKSIEIFHQAFENLLNKPLESELKAENITSYINTLRQEENLDLITERLFLLREKLVYEIGKKDSKLAGEARSRLKVLENVMSQTVGNIAKTVGTETELNNLHANLDKRIDETKTDDQNGTLNFLQNFCGRIGFGNLVEKILIKQEKKQDLIDFYSQNGAFQKVLEIAESENNFPLIAENAKLLNNREKELKALRQIFQDKNANRIYILRYLQVIDKSELESLSKQNSPHQLELINFLLGKGEKEFAHLAIENSDFSKVWKLARHAETSLALKEFDQENECYFCEALKLGTIDEHIAQQSIKTQQLIGIDWFRLSRQYGEWLKATEPQTKTNNQHFSDKFLVGLIENNPKDANEQAKLGEYYLANNEFEKAKQHFQISLELNDDNIDVLGKLGIVLWKLNEKSMAEEIFAKLLEKDISVYLKTLQTIDLQHQAKEKSFPILAEILKQDNHNQNLLQTISNLFNSEKEKAEFFLKLCLKIKDETLVQKLIDQNIIAKEFQQPFQQILLNSIDYNIYNYEFEEIANQVYSNNLAEEIYDHQTDFKIDDDDSLNRQRDFINFLLENNKTSEAKKVVLHIENKISRKIPRPFWLRLAHFQLFNGNLQNLLGIEVTENITNVKPPSIERLNEAVNVLKKLKRNDEAENSTLDFYARMIELEQLETANFISLAKQYFKVGKEEKAIQILQKLTESENFNDYEAVAKIFTEFGQTEKAIEIRQTLAEISPNNHENKFELAKLLPKESSILILQTLINDRNTLRNLRWQAIWTLRELDIDVEIPDYKFDAFSQFYNGILFNDENYFINSLMADDSIKTQSLQQLIKHYVQSNKPFAALKLAEIDKSEKDFELLDLLSKTAKNVGEFNKAIEFEKAKSKIDETTIEKLKLLESEQNTKVTDFTIDTENTRKL